MVDLARCSQLAPAPYAHAAAVPPGTRLVRTAGACPLDDDGATVAAGDVAGQARRTVDNLETALRAAGAGLADVVRTTAYVASSRQEDLVAAWDLVPRPVR